MFIGQFDGTINVLTLSYTDTHTPSDDIMVNDFDANSNMIEPDEPHTLKTFAATISTLEFLEERKYYQF